MDKENFILDFLNINWEEKLVNSELNLATGTFFAEMEELVTRYIPKKKITHREFKRRLQGSQGQVKRSSMRSISPNTRKTSVKLGRESSKSSILKAKTLTIQVVL